MMATVVATPRPRPRLRDSVDRQQNLIVAHQRLMIMLLLFVAGSLLVLARLMWLGIVNDGTANGRGAATALARADIVDRNGQVLARTIDAWSIGIHPTKLLSDPEDLAPKLAQLMPERSQAEYLSILRSNKSFTYLRRRALPDLVAAANALGEPALAFAREPERLYPQTTLAVHVLGYTDFEGRGMAGIERAFDERLASPAQRGNPLVLALDTRVQSILEAELSDAMVKQQAIGATGVVMDVHTGEVVAMVSLPLYNPNKPGRAIDTERRNNVTQSVYELGSTFKPLTFAAAIEAGVIKNMAQRFDAVAPVQIGRFQINDDHPLGRWVTAPEALIHSSNLVTSRIADAMGAERMQAVFRKLRFDQPPFIELRERGHPLWPRDWGRATVMTTGFGHGIAITPLQLAAAYSALVNGGVWRPATLLKVQNGQVAKGTRVFRQETSDRMRQMLRLTVTDGTGKFANADGLRVGGKTGTAEKPGRGGYSKSLQVTTFAAAFPMDAPRYVVVTMLDEPKGNAETFGVRTAGYTAAPVAGKVIARIGPLLGVNPDAGREIDLSDMLPFIERAKVKE